MSTRHLRTVLIVSIILVAVGVIGAFLVLEGIFPPAYEKINLNATLYPYNFTYRYSISIYMGYGSYTIKIASQSNMSVCIQANNYEKEVNLTPGSVEVIKISNTTYVFIDIIAHLKPFQINAGTIYATRRW